MAATVSSTAHPRGNVIFIHPDGTGMGHWNAARLFYAGPDGNLNWDRMERLAAYRVHQKNWLATTSHAGATTHAYGRKVDHDSYGLDRDQPLTALSGKNQTIMEEAMAAGIRVGIINSGHIGEPGTGVFLARSTDRKAVDDIAAQIIGSGADIIFCGGEIYLLPEGQIGRHGREGVRKDGRNLLKEAEAGGYTVIYTRQELIELPASTTKVIGIFAAKDTYNDQTQARLKAAGLPTYDPAAPRFDEMVEVALRILGSDPRQNFFLVAEEEGTDNFSNLTHAQGMLDAMGRADLGIGEALQFINANPASPTLLLVGADSDAGHPCIWAPRGAAADYSMPETTETGAQLDGPDGEGGRPFLSQPDALGNAYPFGIAWPTAWDMQGGAVTRAHGYRSEIMPASLDNTGIYRVMYEVLFGHL